MKKILFSLFVIAIAGRAFGFYDFCESPADYNTFPAAYDVKTEYWKDIPKYNTDDIEYKNIKNKNPIFPLNMRKNHNSDVKSSKKNDN